LSTQVSFAVSQQAMLQGYLPITFLFVHEATRGQRFLDNVVATGPAIMTAFEVPTLRCEPLSFPQCIEETEYEVEFSETLRIVIIAIASVVIFFVLVCAVLTVINHSVAVMHYASPSFLIGMLLGAALIMVGVILFALDDPSEGTCTGALWMGLFGTSLALSMLFAKTFRVWRLLKAAKQLRSRAISDMDLLPIAGGITLLCIVLLAVWTAVDAPAPDRMTSGLQDDEYMIFCNSSEHGIAFMAATIAYFGILLAIGVVLAFLSRKFPSAFDESKWISLSIYCMSVASVIIVIVTFVLSDLEAKFMIVSACVIIAVASFTALLFVPKIYLIYTGRGDEANISSRKSTVGGRSTFASGTSSGATSSTSLSASGLARPIALDLRGETFEGTKTYHTSGTQIDVTFS
jgi:7 transmembrane sweet-taste receptor of 3 GCPR